MPHEATGDHTLMEDPAARRRTAVAVFLTLFGTYAYFFQGGGWNQNSRIAQVRSLVEQRRFAINDYLLYRNLRHRRLLREPLPPETAWEKVADRASSADVAIVPHSGLIYPNKPPGVVLAAAPIYTAAFVVESALGMSSDDWAVITANSHLMTLFSVGLGGALSGVVLLYASRALFPEISLAAHAAAALTLGLGTLMLPYSTVMFDHVLAGFWPLLAFAALIGAPRGGSSRALLAGLAAGLGIVTNYTDAAAAGLLLAYLLATRRAGDAVRFVLGTIPPLLGLAAYQLVCFGSPFAVANRYQYGSFSNQGQALGMFSLPDPDVLWRVLVAPQRGLFVVCPVLVLAAWGLVSAWRAGRRAEVSVAAGFFLFMWLLNGAFNGWHGGWSIGPRYLIPAVPFLALGLAPAFARLPRLTTLVALASAALMLLVTAVDVQPPRRARNPLVGYIWPLWRGDTLGLYPGVDLRGPVSVNPISVCEGRYYAVFLADSWATRWNSYNLGELWFPDSRLSLLPCLVGLGVGIALTLKAARGPSEAPRQRPG